MFRAGEQLDAANMQAVGADAGNVCAHFNQQMRQILNVRFAGGVENGGFTFGKHGGHQDIFGGGNAGFVEYQIGADQRFALKVIRRGVVNFDAECAQSVEMGVEAAAADDIAAGRMNERRAVTRGERSGQENRGAHFAAEFFVELGDFKSFCAERYASAGFFDRYAERHEQFEHNADIGDIRNVTEFDRLIGQGTGRQHRQDCVFVAARREFPANDVAAVDDEFCHGADHKLISGD